VDQAAGEVPLREEQGQSARKSRTKKPRERSYPVRYAVTPSAPAAKKVPIRTALNSALPTPTFSI